jgi:hypothetical protein
MKMVKPIILVVVSAGWIVPLYLGIDSIISFLRLEVYPRLLGQSPLNSFPFLRFSKQMVIIGFAWLAIVSLFWSAVLARHLIRSCPPGVAAAPTTD